MKRPKSVSNLYAFLRRSHHYNKRIQEASLRRALLSCETNHERALLLLHNAVNTQSQPKLEHISTFFQSICNSNLKLDNLAAFRQYLMQRHAGTMNVFDALSMEAGWGLKTSSLFFRNLAIIVASPQLKGMFWPDLNIIKHEAIHFPVDAVIIKIFGVLQDSFSDLDARKLNNFRSINCYLACQLEYDRGEMMIWDDLWFWGFVTQRSNPGNKERVLGWNQAKYWSILTAPKARGTIRRIEKLAAEFLNLLEGQTPTSPA